MISEISLQFLKIQSAFFLTEGAFYFSQKNTEEQISQRCTETLSQPISQNLTANRSLTPAPLRMERGVITEIPLRVLCMFSSPSPIISRPIGITSHTTPLSIRRGAGGEASVNSVCRRPSVGSKCAPKSSVNSVTSVREKTPQQVTCVSSHRVGAFYFSQKDTEEQNTQHSKQVVAPPPSPPPKGRGVITEIPL